MMWGYFDGGNWLDVGNGGPVLGWNHRFGGLCDPGLPGRGNDQSLDILRRRLASGEITQMSSKRCAKPSVSRHTR